MLPRQRGVTRSVAVRGLKLSSPPRRESGFFFVQHLPERGLNESRKRNAAGASILFGDKDCFGIDCDRQFFHCSSSVSERTIHKTIICTSPVKHKMAQTSHPSLLGHPTDQRLSSKGRPHRFAQLWIWVRKSPATGEGGIRSFLRRAYRACMRAQPCCPATRRTEPDQPVCKKSSDAARRLDSTRRPSADRSSFLSHVWPAADVKGHPSAPSSIALP